MTSEEIQDDVVSDDTNETYQWRSSVHYDENTLSPTKQQWIDNFDDDKFKILDPDDPLMKRFQDALKLHLVRIDNKLSNEIKELVRD
jgi:hypothetical protein